MNKQFETEIKVGAFVSIGVGLILLAVLLLGGNNFFKISNQYSTHLNTVDGLVVGSKVTLGGVPVGTVSEITFDHEKKNIVVHFSVERKSGEWVREDSTCEIATQGVLGDKYIRINVGNKNLPVLPNGADLPEHPSQDLSQFLTKGDTLLLTLNSITKSLDRILKDFEADKRSENFFKAITATAKNLNQATEKMNQELDGIQIKKAIAHINQIFEKIDNGTGTVGALINDPGLYEQVKALFGGANRNRVIRNLVRQTVKESGAPNPEPSGQPK